MSGRKVVLYFAWSRPAEAGAPLSIIDDRFPAVFELRRLFYPKYEALSDPALIDQGIRGFLDHIQKPNFAAFAAQAEAQTGHSVQQVERVIDDGTRTLLDEGLLADCDTVVVISFDSLRTKQFAYDVEIEAARRFLADPDHVMFVCPHHDIGEGSWATKEEQIARQTAEYLHHGDHGSPPRQGFGGFAKTLLAGLGVPVENQFGLRPALAADGSPAPIEVEAALDVLGLLKDVPTFNGHPHLPQLEQIGAAIGRMDILARQRIDMTAPPHPTAQKGRITFDSLLQTRDEAFAGKLLVCDTTLFSSTAGGLESLRRLWSNVLLRPKR